MTFRATLILLALLPSAGIAQTCLELFGDTGGLVHSQKGNFGARYVASYYTTIGGLDSQNSAGTKLSNYRAVLRQDRANVNSLGFADHFSIADVNNNGDVVEKRIYDEPDSFFQKRPNRALFATMPLIPTCDGVGKLDDGQSPAALHELQSYIVNATIPGVLHVIVFPIGNGKFGMTLNYAG